MLKEGKARKVKITIKDRARTSFKEACPYFIILVTFENT